MYWRGTDGKIHYSANGVQAPAAEVVEKPEKRNKKKSK